VSNLDQSIKTLKILSADVKSIVKSSAKAIELLNKANIMLSGYVRGGRMNIYSQERRVKI
jgi:FdhD/NarQ family.